MTVPLPEGLRRALQEQAEASAEGKIMLALVTVTGHELVRASMHPADADELVTRWARARAAALCSRQIDPAHCKLQLAGVTVWLPDVAALKRFTPSSPPPSDMTQAERLGFMSSLT